jgi:hypothetical protein
LDKARLPPNPLGSCAIEGGIAEIHTDEERGPSGAVRLGRYVDRNSVLAATLNLSGAVTEGAHGTLEIGLELQLPGRPRITPTVGARAGVLVEEGFVGEVLAATAGLAFRIASDEWIRVGAQVAQHGEADGPHTLLVGYQAAL